MVQVTETNRQPDIDAEVISASSVSADDGTVGTLEATGTFTDPSGKSYTRQISDIEVLDTGPAGDQKSISTVASLNQKRARTAAAESNGLIYVVGGIDSNLNDINSVEEYDPATDTWSTVASLNTAISYLGVAEAGGLIYAFRDNVSEEYDPATDTWSTVASLNTPRDKLAAAEANGLIYAIGGRNASNSNRTNTVEEYDPATDTWSTVASLNTPRDNLAAAEANGLIYAITGVDSNGDKINSVEEYDPATDTWSTVASLNTARQSPAAAEANGSIFVTGGQNPSGSRTDTVEEYDPATDTWSTSSISLNTGRFRHAAAEVNDSVYVIAGVDPSFDYLASTEKGVFSTVLVNGYTASGDTIVSADDKNAIVKNATTGRESNPTLLRSGETVEWQTDKQARLYRTEEN